MKSKELGILIAIGLMSAPALSDELRGRSIASACFGCHGAATKTGAAIPPIIKGAPQAYIENAMKEFRDGKRNSTIMQRIAKGYSDADISAVAQYLANMGGGRK